MPLKKLTLLFVEDDTTAQEHIKMLLEDDVKELYQAYDGREGLKLYEEKNPDIVITDINIPYLNGLELTAKIKEKSKTQPVIIMSAHDDRDNILNSINIGSDGFVTKPIDVDLLYQRLNTIADTLHEHSTQNKKTAKKIKELYNLAHFDQLTQLPNRLMFNNMLTEYIQEATQKSTHFSLFFIDIDNFKTVNDTHGHEAGDFVLQTITSRISTIITKDNIVSRRSGDEFLVLLRNYSLTKEIEDVVKRVLNASSQPIKWEDHLLSLSCSIGISQFPYDSTNRHELLALADSAMYNAKDLGKSNYFFASGNKEYIMQEKDKNILVAITPNLIWHKKHAQLLHNNQEVILTKNELSFLSLLFDTPNYKVNYEQIYFKLWGNEELHKRENVKTLVKTLRRKLPINFISNVFGIGYRIEQIVQI